MTQRVFDIENEKDMQDLWDILPDWAQKIKKNKSANQYAGIFARNETMAIDSCIFKINWHNKTEIIRPIKEVTEEDVGKICKFWDNEQEEDIVFAYGQLLPLDMPKFKEFPYEARNGRSWRYARRLTKQEIKELC